jgi:hypothetical protein
MNIPAKNKQLVTRSPFFKKILFIKLIFNNNYKTYIARQISADTAIIAITNYYNGVYYEKIHPVQFSNYFYTSITRD